MSAAARSSSVAINSGDLLMLAPVRLKIKERLDHFRRSEHCGADVRDDFGALL